MLLSGVVIWILIGVVVGLIALSRGRSFIGWTVYALLIWPVALIHLVCIPRTARGLERKARAEGRSPCPHCSEQIRRGAKICPFCRKEVRPAAASPAADKPYRGLPARYDRD